MRECNILGESNFAVIKLAAQLCVNSQQEKHFFSVGNVFFSKNLVEVILFCFSFKLKYWTN